MKGIEMMRLMLIVVAMSLCWTMSITQGFAQATAKSHGWEILFEGKNVDHWRGYNKAAFPGFGWKIEGGLLIVEKSGMGEEGNAGDIITKKKYGDFEFELEFMISDTSNSGIMYLVVEEEGVPAWHNAPEYQILDDPTYEAMLGDWMDTHRTGDNYDLQMAEKNYSKPVGKWNKARIVKKGNHVEHWLNGHKTIEYEINSPEWSALLAKSKFNEYPGYAQAKEGHIALQDHGHRVSFRNIRIREF